MLGILRKLFLKAGTTADGPRFKVSGRDSFLFIEGNKQITVFVEREGPKRGIAILKESLRTWDSPNKGEVVSEADKARIAELLHQDLNARGIKNYID